MSKNQLIKGKTQNTCIQFFRYVFVGGGATIVQWGLLILFKEIAGMNANLANLIGFLGGLICNYLVSLIWVFDKDKSAIKSKYGEFLAFTLIGVVGLGINQGIIWLFDNPLANSKALWDWLPTGKYYLIGQVIATAVAFLWNFFSRKYLLYNKK